MKMPTGTRPEPRKGLRLPTMPPQVTEQQAAALVDHPDMSAVIGDLTKALEKLVPQVIGVQTVSLDSNGTAAVQYRVPFRALFVDSQSTKVLTVANMPLQSEVPGFGPGIAMIRAGGAVCVNFRAYQWSIYGGSQGDLVTVTAFGNPQPPFAK